MASGTPSALYRFSFCTARASTLTAPAALLWRGGSQGFGSEAEGEPGGSYQKPLHSSKKPIHYLASVEPCKTPSNASRSKDLIGRVSFTISVADIRDLTG